MFTFAISDVLIWSWSRSAESRKKMSRITLSDRYAIEAGIYRRQSLKEIAKVIGKSPLQPKASVRWRWVQSAVQNLYAGKLSGSLFAIQQPALQCSQQATLCMQCVLQSAHVQSWQSLLHCSSGRRCCKEKIFWQPQQAAGKRTGAARTGQSGFTLDSKGTASDTYLRPAWQWPAGFAAHLVQLHWPGTAGY